MTEDRLAERIAAYVVELCAPFPDRHVGGPGNRAATTMVAARLSALGFTVSRTTFDCVDFEQVGATLVSGSHAFEVHVGPYSPPCDLAAALVGASTIEELESDAIRDAIVLLHGELAAGQLMPRNFTFYNPESHRRVYRAIDAHGPAGLIAATGTDPKMVGGACPFPLFEDGDLDVPNAYMKDVDGERLLSHVGKTVTLGIDSRRFPSTGEHVVATRRGTRRGRVVVFAHIDSRRGSPGALDNAGGVATLLGLAELLSKDAAAPGPTVELVPVNGEDDYANPGEMLWVAENEGRFDDIVLGVNVDDAGWAGHDTHVSFYDVGGPLESMVRRAMLGHAGFAEGPKWFQSDHAIFGIHGRPAIAVASADLSDFMAEACHTPDDTPDLVDAEALAHVARFLGEVIRGVGGSAATDAGGGTPNGDG